MSTTSSIVSRPAVGAAHAERQAAIRSTTRPAILPSILSCDFARLKDEVQAVEAAGARMLHLDIMDGHFVPNLSYGPPVIECIRRVTNLPLDTHLMISQPEKYLDDFVAAGCDTLTIHVEAVNEPRRLLEAIKSRGCLAGIALNPPTPASTLRESIAAADLVLVMSVMPGFGGQPFDAATITKLAEVRAMARPGTLIEMDGGINRKTIGAAAAGGAEFLVVGSAIFRANDYAIEIGELSRRASEATGSAGRSMP
jgi:ribulose-phosphate 3-epimerase